jgi:hypothetical protein
MSRLALAIAFTAALTAPALAGADAAAVLRESSSREEMERAAADLEARAAKNPNDYAARLDASIALTQVMAIRTNGNLPLVDGLQDTDANRALWADLGKRALEHARAAEKQKPQAPEAAAALASSYMFYASSLGIIRSILQGAGSEYQVHAKRLIELDPKFDDGLGSSLLANLFMIAPWPVYDRDAALEHFERAAQIAPGSVRNQYGLAVFWARDGDAARARTHFARVVSQPCSANTERLFCDFMKQTARRELARLPAR